LKEDWDILVCFSIIKKRGPTFSKQTAESKWDNGCIKCTFLSTNGISEVLGTVHFKMKISAPVQTGPGAHPATYTMGTGFFPGSKERPGRDAEHSPPYSAVVVKE
jgi:hypothetical protein